MVQEQTKKQFLKNFIKDYKVAAFARSSEILTETILKELDDNLRIVIEQGPGDGVMTKVLLQKLAKDGKLILIEQNKEFIDYLKKINDPRIVIFEGRAQDFEYAKFLKAGEKADLIISSIPFSFLNKQERMRICEHAYENLHPQGKFIVFHQYSLIMKKKIAAFFQPPRIQFVFRNLFPCFVIFGIK